MRIVTPDMGDLRHDSATVYAGEVNDQVQGQGDGLPGASVRQISSSLEISLG